MQNTIARIDSILIRTKNWWFNAFGITNYSANNNQKTKKYDASDHKPEINGRNGFVISSDIPWGKEAKEDHLNQQAAPQPSVLCFLRKMDCPGAQSRHQRQENGPVAWIVPLVAAGAGWRD